MLQRFFLEKPVLVFFFLICAAAASARTDFFPLRSACIKMVLNTCFPLCVHGLRRAVCFNSPSAGLGLTGLPCVILVAAFCLSLLCPVLCPSCRLGLSAALAGIHTFPWKLGFCAYRKSRFRLRKTSVVFAALRPAGRKSNGKIRGNFCSRLQKFPSLILQFSGSENSSGLWAVARPRLTSY